LPAPTVNGGDSFWKWKDFQLSRACDLDLGSGHTAYSHASFIDLDLHAKFHWNRRNLLWTYGHLRSTLLGRLRKVDLKTNENHKTAPPFSFHFCMQQLNLFFNKTEARCYDTEGKQPEFKRLIFYKIHTNSLNCSSYWYKYSVIRHAAHSCCSVMVVICCALNPSLIDFHCWIDLPDKTAWSNVAERPCIAHKQNMIKLWTTNNTKQSTYLIYAYIMCMQSEHMF